MYTGHVLLQNWAASCALFLWRTMSPMWQIGASGRAVTDGYPVVGISHVVETILQSQSSHEDAHFTFTFRKSDAWAALEIMGRGPQG